MSGFFDIKEEVISIELTTLGRHKLARSQFRPAFYEFSDQDIVYSSQYAGLTEAQSEIEPRISEALRLQPQSTNHSTNETHANAANFEYLPLGSMAAGSPYYPAWDIKFHHGYFLSSSTQLSGTMYNAPIPQLNFEIEVKTYSKRKDEGFLSASFNQKSRRFDDGTFFEVVGEYGLLEIGERNTDYQKENYDLHFFLNEGILSPVFGAGEQYRLIPLNFIDGNNINHLNYFLDVKMDHEIDDRILCEALGIETTENVFIPRIYDCRDNISLTDKDKSYHPFEGGKKGEIC